MDEVSAIQAMALRAVVNEEPEFLIRRVMRWYSTTFHTPLHLVEDLPMDYILTHFFEHSIDNLDAAGRKKLIATVSGSEAEKASDEEFLKKTREQAKERKKRVKKKVEKAKKIIKAAEEQDFLAAADVEQVIKQATASLNDLPDLTMKFDPNLDQEDVLSGR